jgi:hypothetical protein
MPAAGPSEVAAAVATTPPTRPGGARPVHLTLLKVVILVVNLFVGGLGAAGAYSVLYALDVELPTQNDVKPRVDGDTLYLSSNATVHNRGFFNVDDVEISVRAATENGTVLVDYHNAVGTIGTGTQKIRVDVPLKISELVNKTWLIWTPTNMTFSVSVKAQYLYRLVDFEATHFYFRPWPALVKYVKVDWENVEYIYPAENLITIRIPYQAGVDKVLNGLVLDTTINIVNDASEVIGTSTAAITLQEKMDEHLDVTFDRRFTTDLMTRSQDLKIQITGFFAGQKGTVTNYTRWWAPMTGLDVTPNRGPTWVFADYRFTNEADYDLDLQVTMTALDSAGSTIASTTQFKVVPGCPSHAGCPLTSGSIGTSDPSMANAVKVKLTFEDRTRGMRYIVEIPLVRGTGGSP